MKSIKDYLIILSDSDIYTEHLLFNNVVLTFTILAITANARTFTLATETKSRFCYMTLLALLSR